MARHPEPEECIAMLRDAGCSEKVIDHCIAVNALAMKMCEAARLAGHEADCGLVNAGSLLHDIGRSVTHRVDHGLVGMKIAREMGMPDGLLLIIERHIGAGIAEKDAIDLGLPPRDYLPETLEEKIVCHADSLMKHDKIQSSQEAEDALEKRGFPEAARRLRALHQELSQACGVDIDEIWK